MKILLTLTLLISCFSVFAVDDFSGKSTMNGISHQDYQDFAQKWDLVTIRFRKDTGEMRITYANELAMKTLREGSINYPDGAVFAKIGFQTAPDSQFISSVVPKNIRRYQYMVKDKKKYSSTNGWGYGLFDPQGKTFPEDPQTTQMACYACHTIVENRGDVFSEPFQINQKAAQLKLNTPKPQNQIAFENITSKQLPESIQKLLPKKIKSLRQVSTSILRQHLFQGSLDEMKPMLEAEAQARKLPALYADSEYRRFVLVIPQKTFSECLETGGYIIHSTDRDLKIVTEKYCTHD